LARKTLRIRGEAEKALHSLSDMFQMTPNKFVERLLIENWQRIQDGALCKKDFFRSSVIFQLELPFCFPYECEKFEVQLKDTKVRLYLERVPKRNMKLLPFRTLATVIIQLKSKDEKCAKETEQHIAYNIGVIQPPVNFEAFKKAVKMSLMIEEKEYANGLFMSVQEESFINVKQGLDKQLHSDISSKLKQLTERKHSFLTLPMDYFDAAMVFFYEERWNLCLLNSVVSMESAMTGLVFQTSARKLLMNMRSEDPKRLREKYKEAASLPKKIERFLYPLLKELDLVEVERRLKTMMPFISNKKTKKGIYDLRSKILHEGASIRKVEARKALKISKQFLHVLQLVSQNVS